MGFYVDRIVPRALNTVCGSRYFDYWRDRVCEGLGGDILEIGFGSGTNIKHLPPTVDRVVAVEPAGLARDLARLKISNTDIAISFVDVIAGTLPLVDDSFDGALCTFTLCTVERPEVVLGEIRRVLKPGASLHFLEHGLSPERRTAAWQHRLNGWEQRLAGGCQLIRDPQRLVRDAQFKLEWSEHAYAKGPKPWSYFTLGVASKP